MNDYYLNSATAKEIYSTVEKMPICDYHCHLSPKEIYEDEPFEDLVDVWLGGDHYKWRLMRQAGVEERFITGDAPKEEKLEAYLGAIEGAVGNPLAVWSREELRLVFGIPLPLTRANAEEIRRLANEKIRKERLSPRKLMHLFGVRFVATTDDPADTLEYHEKIKESGFDVTVTPSFRPDNALAVWKKGYADYLGKLGEAAGTQIRDLGDLEIALEKRMAFFKVHGCLFADVGIDRFPHSVADFGTANGIFAKVLEGQPAEESETDALLGHLFVFLGNLYAKYGIVSQWHLGAVRNPNTKLYAALGADCGCDCVGAFPEEKAVLRLLDAIQNKGGLPETVLYTLNPNATAALVSIAGSFPRVRVGAAWWFNDHRSGITDVLNLLASEGHLGSFWGMLTDSRSFLSYARHDYFRRLLSSFLAHLYEIGEATGKAALITAAKNISYFNIAKKVGIEP